MGGGDLRCLLLDLSLLENPLCIKTQEEPAIKEKIKERGGGLLGETMVRKAGRILDSQKVTKIFFCKMGGTTQK